MVGIKCLTHVKLSKTISETLRISLVAGLACVTFSTIAGALSLSEQKRYYLERLIDKKPGIYKTHNSFIIIAEVKCGNAKRFSNKRGKHRVRAELLLMIARERQKRLRNSLKNLPSLRAELIRRQYKFTAKTKFKSLLVEATKIKRSPCRYRRVEAIEKSAFLGLEKFAQLPLHDLEKQRTDLFKEYLRQNKLKKLAEFYQQEGMPALSAVHGLNYLSQQNIPSYNFPAINRIHSVISTRSEKPITGRDQAVRRIRRIDADCPALSYLALEAGGVNRPNLELAKAPACSFESQLLDWDGRKPEILKMELAQWYAPIKPEDARGLIEASIRSYGMLRFAENVSYGDQGVAMVDRDRGFKLFEAAKNPREILKLLTGYLSQLPVDWNAWNKLGAVLRALSFPQSALSAHTQALNTGGINATTLAHLAKDHEVAGNINFAKLYAEEVLRGYYPHSDKAWAIETVEGILQK